MAYLQVASAISGGGTPYVYDGTTNSVLAIGEDYVGIGTSSPASDLHIVGAASPTYQLTIQRDNDGPGAAKIKLYHKSASPSTSDAAGSIGFFEENSAAEEIEYGKIVVCHQCTNSSAT